MPTPARPLCAPAPKSIEWLGTNSVGATFSRDNAWACQEHNGLFYAVDYLTQPRNISGTFPRLASAQAWCEGQASLALVKLACGSVIRAPAGGAALRPFTDAEIEELKSWAAAAHPGKVVVLPDGFEVVSAGEVVPDDTDDTDTVLYPSVNEFAGVIAETEAVPSALHALRWLDVSTVPGVLAGSRTTCGCYAVTAIDSPDPAAPPRFAAARIIYGIPRPMGEFDSLDAAKDHCLTDWLIPF